MSYGLGLAMRLSRNIHGARGGGGFTVPSMFRAAEQGVWYDPSDFERYMAGRGPELVADPGFDNAALWTLAAGYSVSGGNLVATAAGAGLSASPVTPTVIEAGKTYELVYVVTALSAGGLRLVCGGMTTAVVTAPGTYTYAVTAANAGGGYVQTQVGATTATIASFSVRELTALSTATLFQDAAGTTPVTAMEQPVGLMLDKRLGLVRGAELLPNGDFSAGVTGWDVAGADATHVVTFTGGACRYQSDTTSPQMVVGASGVALVIGRTYEIVVTTSLWASGAVKTDSFATAPVISSGVGTSRFRATAQQATFAFTRSTANVDLTIESISVREIPGNHATQPTAAARPVLSSRKNWLTYSEDLGNAVWAQLAATVVTNAALSPDGTMTADKLVEDVSSSAHRFLAQGANNIALVVGQQVTYSVYVKAAGSTHTYIRINNSGGDLVTGTVRLSDGVVTQTVIGTITTELVGDYVRIKATGVSAAAAAAAVELRTGNADTYANYAGNVANGILVWGQQLESGAIATRYQRVTTATDYDSVGFPHYLKFDGVDDFLVTNSIDFTGTDKMTVWAGVRRGASTALNMLLELGAGGAAGSFYLAAPYDATRDFAFVLNGTATSARTYDALPNPATGSEVVSCVFDIGGATVTDEITPRINGASGTITNFVAGPAGTGNFGNHPLYFGRRAGTSLPFNGHLYSLTIRGAASSAAQISSGETFTNSKTGAY